MNLSDFSFSLPAELIAQVPLAREESRLLKLDRLSGEYLDSSFPQLSHFLKPHDLLIFNDTKVIPARLFGVKESGGQVELLIERILLDNQALAHIRASKPPKPNSKLQLDNNLEVVVLSKKDDLYLLQFPKSVLDVLDQIGHIPLPPYITRLDTPEDRHRFQTVYAKHPGAVAAPTAGLHFTEVQIQSLKQHNIQMAYVTLHVGAGTFMPIRGDDIHEHIMHKEFGVVPQKVCEQIQLTKQKGGRVIAVGTTSARILETAASTGRLQAFCGETQIFIYPGFTFRIIDGLITNFHLPKSTLLLLVSAFVGQVAIAKAYRHAIAERYRFFSYGDAMLIL